jgi:hypothetical protein
MTGGAESLFGHLATRFAERFQARTKALAVWLPRLAYGLVVIDLVLQIFKLAGSYLGHLNSV